MTLVEVMIAMLVFSLMSGSALLAIIQTRKMAEDNAAQATARTLAQGIIEQMHASAYDPLAATPTPPPPGVPTPTPTQITVNLVGLYDTSGKFAPAPVAFKLDWKPPTDTNFQDIGVPLPFAPANLAILLDSEYRDASNNLLRPARYMRMQVRLTHDPTLLSHDCVGVVLQYRWAPPSRNTLLSPTIWVTREIRTVISKAYSF
jgi:type II secretory pathway pseudopilin PulG